MDSDLLPELSGETWVASALLEELTVDLLTAGSDIDLVAVSREDNTLQTVRSWVESGNAPLWPACAGLSPELRCWRLQVGNLTMDSVGRLWRRRSPPVRGVTVSGSSSRTPGPDSTVSRFIIRWTFGGYTHDIPLTG